MSDTCVFTFMRCNPVHIGHGYVFDRALELQYELQADLKLFLTATVDDTKNPLPLDLKKYYINGFFPEIGSVLQNDTKIQLFDVMASLSGSYDNIIFIGGSDRKDEFKYKLDKYNGVLYNFRNIDTEMAGVDRTICQYSSTMMRACAVEKDYDTFRKALPGDDDSLKYQMFIDVQNRIKHVTK